MMALQKVDASARYSLSCPCSRRLEDTLGPGDDDGGGVFPPWGLMDARSQRVRSASVNR